MDEPLLKVEGLRIGFVTRTGVIQAIDDVSFEINSGETFGLVGETGCGKSQTAMAIMRLTPEGGVIENGEINFNGNNLTKNIKHEFVLIKKNGQVRLKRNKSELKRLNTEMGKIRGKHISMIFQEPMTSLNPLHSIGKQISEVVVKHNLDEIIDRILSRDNSDGEQLKEMATLAIRQKVTRERLLELARTKGMEGLADQIWFIINRRDIGSDQKIQAVSDLAERRIGTVTRKFLTTLKKTQGKIPIKYRVLSKIPLVKNRFMGAIVEEARAISYELLSLVDMPNARTVLDQYPHELSGGMRQRAMIAMSIAAKPRLVIADEPTSALDVTVQAQILDLLRDLKKAFGASVLFISHDFAVIAEICDRVGVMYAGNIVEIADLKELFANPKHPYTQGLLAAIPKYGDKRETLLAIKGTVPDLMHPPEGCRFNTRCPRAFEKCTQKPPWVSVGKEHMVLCWLFEDGQDHVE
jgi:peptide/nickel transport system ATP-binding protein